MSFLPKRDRHTSLALEQQAPPNNDVAIRWQPPAPLRPFADGPIANLAVAVALVVACITVALVLATGFPS